MDILPQGQSQADETQVPKAGPVFPQEIMGRIILHAINQPAVYIFDLTIDDWFGARHIPSKFTPSGCEVAFHPVCSPPPRNCNYNPASSTAETADKNENENEQNKASSSMAIDEHGTYEPQASKTIRALMSVNRFFHAQAMRHLQYISAPTVTNSLNKVWFNPSIHIICIRNTHTYPSKTLGPNPVPYTELNFRIEHLAFLHSCSSSSRILHVFDFVFPALCKLYSVIIDHPTQPRETFLPLEPVFQERHAELYSPVALYMFKRYWLMNKRVLLTVDARDVKYDLAGYIKRFVTVADMEGLILR